MSRGRVLATAAAAAFFAAMLAGPGAVLFPSTLRWAGWIACPSGTTAAPGTFRAPPRAPGETGVVFRCVASDGTTRERTPAALGGLWLMYFTGIFTLLSLLAARETLRHGGVTRASTTAPPRPVSADVERKARELIMSDEQKIHAIAVVRDATEMGLREATEWVEALARRARDAAAPADGTRMGGLGAVERLAELKQRFDAGLITADEFEAKKAEILAGL